MGQIKLYRIGDRQIRELESRSTFIDRPLQRLIEENLMTLLAIRLLASDYPIAGSSRQMVDSLGIDENHAPVVIQYQRSDNQQIVTEGLYYIDRLLENKTEFQHLVLKAAGKHGSDPVDWSNPRLVCMADRFSRFDRHTVQQLQHNIELIRIKEFDIGFFMIELVDAVSGTVMQFRPSEHGDASPISNSAIAEALKRVAGQPLGELYQSLARSLDDLGDEIHHHEFSDYIAFKRLRNVACVTLNSQADGLLIYLNLEPDQEDLIQGLTRDVHAEEHPGTGDLEIRIDDIGALDVIRPLLMKSYKVN
jgi:predicted transport protein